MKYLVTGGGGFIGSHLATKLASLGHDVVVLDNFSTGKRENLEGVPVQIIEGDIRDFECVSRAVEGVDTVFHQAALCSVSRSINNPILSHAVNTTGFLNVLEACRQEGVRRVVFASSSSVYGDTETLPKVESMPASPLSPYAVNKLMGEYYCQLYWKLFGLETVALRYFNVFGPRQDPTSEYAAVIPKFLDAIMNRTNINIFGDGSQTRDFTYIDNIVQANIAASSSKLAAGEIMNVACGDRWSLLQLVDKLEQIMQCDVTVDFQKRRGGDVKHSQASIKLAHELMDYSPQVGFDDGIKQTVSWFFGPGCTDLAPELPASQDRQSRAM